MPTARLLSWRLLHPPCLAWDQSAKRGAASSVTLSVARAPFAGFAVTTTTSVLTAEARMSTGYAVLHDQESPPGASDAGAPSAVVLNDGTNDPKRRVALRRSQLACPAHSWGALTSMAQLLSCSAAVLAHSSTRSPRAWEESA